MLTLLVIAAAVFFGFGLFAWRHDVLTGQTAGIAGVLHDRLKLRRLPMVKGTQRDRQHANDNEA